MMSLACWCSQYFTAALRSNAEPCVRPGVVHHIHAWHRDGDIHAWRRDGDIHAWHRDGESNVICLACVASEVDIDITRCCHLAAITESMVLHISLQECSPATPP